MDDTLFGKLIAVTNRILCERPFLEQIERVLACKPHALLLREKDLEPEAYCDLARKVLAACNAVDVPCYLHGRFIEQARELGCTRIHLPFAQLETEPEERLKAFEEISISCHSIEEVRRAEALGASSIVLGTIFETDCKPGKRGEGLDFLRGACESTTLPVFAIGGIAPERMADVLEAGAAGGCMMSGFMKI